MTGAPPPSRARDLLPSWTDSPARTAILDFVFRATRRRGPDYLRTEERIAVFDTDGTLWCEMPRTVEAHYVDARLRALGTGHPRWRAGEPCRTALVGGWESLSALGPRAVAELMMATHAGVTTEEFAASVRHWLSTTSHPTLGASYSRCVYQPMRELLRLLRHHGFTSYLVGGSVEFTRVYAGQSLGIPPQRVIGSTTRTHFELRQGLPHLVREPVVDLLDDRAAKPAAVERLIGRRPALCVGNSDGDRELLLWTTCGRTDAPLALGVLVHHTDAEREFEYDREPQSSGRLSRSLDEAEARGWVVADMRRDWRSVFPGDAGGARLQARA